MCAAGADWPRERMARYAGRDAFVAHDVVSSYAHLASRIAKWRRRLREMSLSPGAVVGFRGDGTADSCALFLALTGHRCVAVPLPGGSEELSHYLNIAGVQALLECEPPSDAWSCARFARPEPAELLRGLTGRGAAGVVIFSSGSTGEPKAGLFDFATLLKRYRDPRPGYRTLLFLQLDHLGGVHTMLHALSNGGALIVPESRTPDAVCRAIEYHRVELLPATPTFLRMLALSDASQRHDLSSLRLITYGTEPMPPATLKSLMALFPDVAFKQTYGLSELGVLPSRSKAPGSLWLELGGVGCETRIVDNVLWIRSDTAMLGYLNAPSPFDAEGWYNTEDAVETDGRYVRVLGRASDLINVGGQKVHPAEVENVLLEMDNIREATVWARANPVTGQIVAARLSLAYPEDHDALEARMHEFCRGRLQPFKIPLHIEIAESDHHGRRFKKMRPSPAAAPRWPARSS